MTEKEIEKDLLQIRPIAANGENNQNSNADIDTLYKRIELLEENNKKLKTYFFIFIFIFFIISILTIIITIYKVNQLKEDNKKKYTLIDEKVAQINTENQNKLNTLFDIHSKNSLSELNKNYNKNISIEDEEIAIYGIDDNGLIIFKDINFINLKSLTFNGDMQGSITNISFLTNKIYNNLENIEFSFNNITDISILSKTNLTHLKTLSFYGNQIEDIDVLEQTNFSDLEVLRLSGNNITNISILSKVNFQKLHSLLFSYNQIEDINVLEKVNFPELKYLSLSKNNIKDISALKNASFSKLIELDLSENPISNLDVLLSCNFTELQTLSLVSIENNENLAEQLSTSNNFPKLEYLFIDNNNNYLDK